MLNLIPTCSKSCIRTIAIINSAITTQICRIGFSRFVTFLNFSNIKFSLVFLFLIDLLIGIFCFDALYAFANDFLCQLWLTFEFEVSAIFLERSSTRKMMNSTRRSFNHKLQPNEDELAFPMHDFGVIGC